ncbi:MAG: sterol desaturase family protein [Actinobacteria bacterium]|nr:sterol desaturase family protein [Actinomycetota bacterium]
MGAEYVVQKRRAAEHGPTPGTYERRDTIASLTMGTASLFAPLVIGKVLEPVTPGKGRYAKALVATAAGAAVVATVADVVGRRGDGPLPPAGSVPTSFVNPQAPAAAAADDPDPGWQRPDANREERRGLARWARKVGSSAAVTAVAAGAVAAGATWASRTSARRLWERRVVRDLGDGPLAVAGAILAWDLLYYWNHRLAHESRYLWAMHVVHHSSEHYNLSTALRQPVADALVVTIPYSALALLGFRPDVIETARGVNLLYQFWVHTEVIDSLGKAEKVMNSPSLHRVHHGSNRKYLDRNHAGIFIVWDRLFGTHQVEDEPVVYGLTTNIETYDPLRIAAHEFADILDDVAHATTWRDRLSYVLRGPGWAYERRAGRPAPAATAA